MQQCIDLLQPLTNGHNPKHLNLFSILLNTIKITHALSSFLNTNDKVDTIRLLENRHTNHFVWK